MVEEFTVKYDGPALAEHRMPITELAPALLALSELFLVAHRITTDGTTPPPALEAQANREGSFAVELILNTDQVVDLLNQRETVAVATGLALLEPVVNALRYLRLWIQKRGEEPEIAEIEPGTIRIRWADGTEFEAPIEAKDLADNMDFRRATRDALTPLDNDRGIDTVEIQPRGDLARVPAVTLERADAHALDTPPDDTFEIMSDVVRTVGLRPLKVSLEAGYKWWVSDGSNPFWVEMHDLDFMNRVEHSGEAFAAGDILRVRLRDRQVRDAEGALRMEHTVLEVLQHLRNPPPDTLPFADEEQDSEQE